MNAPFTPVQVRQLAQYPRQDAAIPGTLLLMQMGEAGSPYGSILASDLVTSALADGGNLSLSAATGRIAFLFDQGAGAVTLSVSRGELLVSTALRTSILNATFVNAESIAVGGLPVVTAPQLAAVAADNVRSFNSRQGDVLLEEGDILRAGGAPQANPHFSGWVLAPSHWDVRIDDDTVATAHWVHDVLRSGCFSVRSLNGRSGCVVLQTSDVNTAFAVPGPPFPSSQNPPFGDASSRIATTLFVDEALSSLELALRDVIARSRIPILDELQLYAKLDSPQFIGIPTAPTANPGTTTGQLATTAFVMAAVTASTTGVASFNTRTGAVVLNAADLTAAGGALINSPAFTGTPTAPLAAPGNSTGQIATTAWVHDELATITAGVTTWNGRSGIVTMTAADIMAVGGALLASPNFGGVPTAPTANPGSSTNQLATTAFVSAAVAAVNTGVLSFNGRTGAVNLLGNDVSAAGGALINSPTFTGIPSAPTAAGGTNTTQLATTAFVAAALASASVVTSFNTRTGAVALTLGDVTGVGGAPLASPDFTGTPTAPTATPGTDTTQIATTAFVAEAVAGGGATVLRSYLAGLTLSTAGSSLIFSVAPGVAADSTSAQMMTLSAALAKTNSAWSAGNGGGALDTGVDAANVWYHVFLIMRPDIGAVDVLTSRSPTAPVLPPNYTLFRRIGSMKTNASLQWFGFVQNGDEFILTNSVTDVNTTVMSTFGVPYALPSVPTGVKVNAMGRAGASGASAIGVLILSPDQAVETYNSPVGNITIISAGNLFGRMTVNVRTDTSANIMVIAQSVGITFQWVTYGWIDRRGRDA